MRSSAPPMPTLTERAPKTRPAPQDGQCEICHVRPFYFFGFELRGREKATCEVCYARRAIELGSRRA